MADTLLIHFDPAHPQQASWSHVNNHGELTSRITTGELADATEVANSYRVVVILDSFSVHLNHVKLPTSNRQKMLRAVPYALEEQLAEDVDDFHFVIGKSDTPMGTPVAGIRKEVLKNVIQIFEQAGIHLDAIIPDALCLPASPEQWSVLIHDNKALIQFDTEIGTAIDTNILPLMLQASIDRAEQKPEKLTLFYLDGTTLDTAIDEVNSDAEIIKLAYNTHPLVVFCGEFKRALQLNLLQDKFKPKRKSSGQWQRWRIAASLAAIWAVLYLGTTGLEIVKLDKANSALSAQIEGIYKKTFPRSKRIVNPRVQMEQKLNELKGGGVQSSQFMALLTNSVTALSGAKNVTIQSIDFRNNRMDIGITSTNLQSVETLNKQLNANRNLKAEIVSATSEKNIVKGSIRLQKAGT